MQKKSGIYNRECLQNKKLSANKNRRLFFSKKVRDILV